MRLFPYIVFIDHQSGLFAQSAEFILKTELPVMCLLAIDVLDDGRYTRHTDPKGSISLLPMETGYLRKPGMKPLTGRALYLAHQIGDAFLLSHRAEQVDVISRAVDSYGWRSKVPADTRHVSVEFAALGRIGQCWHAVAR